MELAPGTMVTPNLRLTRRLGEGAMGSVWVAEHLRLRLDVAIKFMSPVIKKYRSYQPLGYLRFRYDLEEECTDYRRVLDYGKAISIVSFTQDGVRYQRESFVSNPHHVLVVRLTSDMPGRLSFELSLDRPGKPEPDNLRELAPPPA